MTVRAATAADLDALVALEVECEGVDAWPRALIEPGVAGELPTTTWWVADDLENGVVGYAVFAVAGDIAELQRIGVTASRRRQGLAGALLAHVVARVGAADRLLIEVRADNSAALAFYARAGFVEIDRRPKYYADGATAVVMRLALRP